MIGQHMGLSEDVENMVSKKVIRDVRFKNMPVIHWGSKFWEFPVWGLQSSKQNRVQMNGVLMSKCRRPMRLFLVPINWRQPWWPHNSSTLWFLDAGLFHTNVDYTFYLVDQQHVIMYVLDVFFPFVDVRNSHFPNFPRRFPTSTACFTISHSFLVLFSLNKNMALDHAIYLE